MIGEIHDLSYAMSADFKDKGDIVILLGETFGHIGGSEYLKIIHKQIAGGSPKLNLHNEKKLQNLLLNLIRNKLIKSAHDLSDGGLIIALAESCVYALNKGRSLGVNIRTNDNLRPDFFYFGEDQSRILISLSEICLNKVKEVLDYSNLSYNIIGEVIENNFDINSHINLSVHELQRSYNNSLRNILDNNREEQNSLKR
jgi:phosphoribosylformylglycinamidine synthase subunit PurL